MPILLLIAIFACSAFLLFLDASLVVSFITIGVAALWFRLSLRPNSVLGFSLTSADWVRSFRSGSIGGNAILEAGRRSLGFHSLILALMVACSAVSDSGHLRMSLVIAVAAETGLILSFYAMTRKST